MDVAIALCNGYGIGNNNVVPGDFTYYVMAMATGVVLVTWQQQMVTAIVLAIVVLAMALDMVTW